MAARKKARKTRTSRASRTSSKTRPSRAKTASRKAGRARPRSSRARTVTKKARTPRTAKKAGKARPSKASARRPAKAAPTMAARGAPRTAAVMPKKTLVGTVSHYFSGIGVGVIEVIRDLKVGDTISIEGSTTNFTQRVTSLQIERMSVSEVKAGESVGIKVVDKIREGDRVFRA